MADEAKYYAEVAAEAAVQLTDSLTEWTSFLSAAGRLYKWPYEDQLLIYAQRPDATACAEYQIWNRLNRYIQRDAAAIVLLDHSGMVPAPRYVFDFSDTRSGANGKAPWFWQYHDRQHFGAVSAALDEAFGKLETSNMEDRLEEIASRLADAFWNDHWEEILDAIEGSYLEEYDELNVETAFRRAASISIAWSLLSRCNLAPEETYQREDFENVFEFNTPVVVAALGCAVSESTERVLRVMETAVKNYEREKRKERSSEYGPSSDLHTGGRLSGPECHSGGNSRKTFGRFSLLRKHIPTTMNG